MQRVFAGLLALVLLGLAPAARAIPFTATLGFTLEGAYSPIDFRWFEGEAVADAGGSLRVDGTWQYPFLGRVLYGPSFYVYVAILGGKAPGALAGTLAPAKGPAGGFGGSLPLQRVLSQGFVVPTPLYTSACFGLGRVGRSKSQFACGAFGTLVSVTGWTTGNVTLTGMGGATLRARGSDARTPGGRGNLLLVTPIRIEGGLHPYPLVGFGTLSLALVPEPGTLALTASGALGLAALGRRRGRHRRA
jgi:hypothetical protein